MTTRIPQNPLTSISCPIRASSSRAFRVPNVSAEASRKGAEGRSIPTQTFVASSAEARGGTLFNTRDHDRLDEWVRISQTKQETWYDEIKRQSQQWGTILQTKATQARTESSEARRQELETYWQIQEQQLAEHRSRLAEAAERRRIAQEERQRAIEEEALLQRLQLEAEEEHRRWEAEEAAEQRRIAQEEQQRMIEEEARLQRLRLEAEEEHRRREAEAAERRRRERERECAVCLEMNDMGGMIQTPCQHWYCQEHLRAAMEAALTSRRPFQCCQTTVPMTGLPNLFSADFQARYKGAERSCLQGKLKDPIVYAALDVEVTRVSIVETDFILGLNVLPMSGRGKPGRWQLPEGGKLVRIVQIWWKSQADAST